MHIREADIGTNAFDSTAKIPIVSANYPLSVSLSPPRMLHQ